MRILRTFVQDPDEDLDYSIDYSALLVTGETISTSVWEVSPDDALVIGDDGTTGDVNTVWLSGGTDGSDYVAINRITTSAGRTYERAVKILSRATDG